jgi:hypothetical protein
MHVVPIALGVLVFLVIRLVRKRRRARAKLDTAVVPKSIDGSISPMGMLFVVPFGLFVDLVFAMLIVAVLFGALWLWAHFFGPFRPVHEWFS